MAVTMVYCNITIIILIYLDDFYSVVTRTYQYKGAYTQDTKSVCAAQCCKQGMLVDSIRAIIMQF